MLNNIKYTCVKWKQCILPPLNEKNNLNTHLSIFIGLIRRLDWESTGEQLLIILIKGQSQQDQSDTAVGQ